MELSSFEVTNQIEMSPKMMIAQYWNIFTALLLSTKKTTNVTSTKESDDDSVDIEDEDDDDSADPEEEEDEDDVESEAEEGDSESEDGESDLESFDESDGEEEKAEGMWFTTIVIQCYVYYTV